MLEVFSMHFTSDKKLQKRIENSPATEFLTADNRVWKRVYPDVWDFSYEPVLEDYIHLWNAFFKLDVHEDRLLSYAIKLARVLAKLEPVAIEVVSGTKESLAFFSKATGIAYDELNLFHEENGHVFVR